MSQAPRALIAQLWPKNIPLLERYLELQGARTVITFQGCVSPEFEATVRRQGGELVVLDAMLGNLVSSTLGSFEQQLLHAFTPDVRQALEPTLTAAGIDWDAWTTVVEQVAGQQFPVAQALVAALDRLAIGYAIELIVVNEDWLLAAKTTVAWGKARGVPTLHLEHNPTLCYPYTVHDQQNAERMVVWSDDSRRLYGDAHFDPQRLSVLGLPQFDHLRAARAKRQDARLKLCAELGLDPGRPLVVLGTTLLADHMLASEPDLQERSVRAYLNVALALRGEAQVVIKGRRPAGRFDAEAIAALAATLGLTSSDYRYADSAPLAFLLAADLIVAVDSGLLVEAMLVDTPAINLQTETGFFYGPGLTSQQGVDTIAAEELPEAIRRLLTCADWRESRLARARAYVASLPTDSTAAVAAHMAQLALADPQRLSGGDELQQWLMAVTPPTAEVDRLLAAYRSQGLSPPRLGVVIKALGHSAQALETTLHSLAGSLYPEVVPLVLDAGDLTLPADINRLTTTPEACVATLNGWLAEADVGWVLQVEAGSEFAPGGLLALALGIARAPDCRGLYADEFQISPQGARGGSFKPDFNLDLLLSFPCSLSRHWLFRRELVLSLGGFDPVFAEASELEFILRLVEDQGLAGLEHVPEILLSAPTPRLQASPAEQVAFECHLQKRGYLARIESPAPGRYLIDYGFATQPRVTLVIAVRDHLELVQRCLDSVLERTQYPNYEIVLVDMESREPETRLWLEGIEALASDQVKVWRFANDFNQSAMINAVAAACTSEFLLLLAHDSLIVQPDWLDRLLNHGQRAEVGVVGAKLLDEDGRIEQAGLILGLQGAAGPAFRGEAGNAPGYFNRLQSTQNYSAVGAACLLVRRQLLLDVGGWDEGELTHFYGDVDFCLRLRQAGYLVVWTPEACLVRRGIDLPASTLAESERTPRRDAERDQLQRRWLPLLARDPAYNLNLSLEGAGFTFDYGRQRQSDSLLPRVLLHGWADEFPVHLRLRQPLVAAWQAEQLDGLLCMTELEPLEQERFQATSLVFQTRGQPDELQRLQPIVARSSAFKVLQVEGNFTTLSAELVQAGGLVDRVVVANAAQAALWAGVNDAVWVAPTCLLAEAWGAVSRVARSGSLPRIGWYCQATDVESADAMREIIQTLAGRVEWVVLGICPPSLLPFVKEMLVPDPSLDAATLSGLALDLALVPPAGGAGIAAEDLILKLGACAVPVMCSATSAGVADLPVLVLPDTTAATIAALEEALMAGDELALVGAQLQTQVRARRLLTGPPLGVWVQAWLPL